MLLVMYNVCSPATHTVVSESKEPKNTIYTIHDVYLNGPVSGSGMKYTIFDGCRQLCNSSCHSTRISSSSLDRRHPDSWMQYNITADMLTATILGIMHPRHARLVAMAVAQQLAVTTSAHT